MKKKRQVAQRIEGLEKNYSYTGGYRRKECGNGPTIPIINISRGFSEVHSSKEGTCIQPAHFIVHAPSVHSSRSPTYTASISLLAQKYFPVFECVRAHAGWFSSFFPFFSPSLRHLLSSRSVPRRSGQRLVFRSSNGDTSFVPRSVFTFFSVVYHNPQLCPRFEK